MEVQTIVSKVEANFDGYTQAGNVDELIDHWIRKDIWSVCTTDQNIRTYFAAIGNAAMKRRRMERII